MSVLSHSLIEALRQDYRTGFGPSQTAQRHLISYGTVKTYFSRFQRTNVTRGPSRPYAGRHEGQPAAYVGSPWIGAAITPPPVPIGPDWIGKPV